MAKHIFFSFHYDDIKTFRANVVRNRGFTKENGQEAGVFDRSIWEDAKLHGAKGYDRIESAVGYEWYLGAGGHAQTR